MKYSTTCRSHGKAMTTMLVLVFFCISCRGFNARVSEQPIELSSEAQSLATRAMLPQSTVRIRGLKAVLIGAPIDGKTGSLTKREIENLRLARNQLKYNGVQVFEFYSPDTEWRKIKRAARGAHFLLYRGHGVYDGSRPPGWVGGFSLQGNFVSPDQIKKGLKLAPGAIVMLYGCFTAGNSGFDIGKIDQQEAARRVAMYSRPFLDNRFSAYYANWYGDAFEHYIAHLFSGKSLGSAFKAYRDYNPDTVEFMKYPGSDKKVLWIDHDTWKAGIVYNNAFAGSPEATLEELFATKK